MGRCVHGEETVFAETFEQRPGRFDGVDQILPRLGFRADVRHPLATCGPIDIDLDPGILALETLGQLFTRAARERRVLDDFAFGLRPGEKNLLPVGAGVGGEIRQCCRFQPLGED